MAARVDGTMDGFGKICPLCGLRYDAAAQFCTKDGSTLRLTEEERDPRIGQVLLDQFRIEEAIGTGGMGAVYRARQTTLARDVAIKILLPEMAQNPEAVRRFQREARISTALDHPNVVRVFLFGQLPDGSLYLVMELLRGRTLAELLRIEPQLPVARALHISTQIAAGVGEAHAQGVVHRDVKPENVFLVTKGKDPDFVKVLDFGIARLFRAEDPTHATQSGLVFGTARYISPEGAAGEKTDARSDVYSLGVLTYQLLAGETPFPAATPVTLLMQHIHERPPHLKSKAGGAQVPDAIADVVMRALSKRPEGRFEDASDFADALREAAARAGIDLRGRGMAERREPSGRVPHEPTLGARPSLTGGGRDTPSPTELGTMGLPRRSSGMLGRAAVVLLAFVVGASLVAGGAMLLELYTRSSEEEARRETLALAERALAEERWEGEASVRMLTDRLLAESPEDPDALRIRAAAARVLVREGRSALDAGQRDEAQRALERALLLAPADADADALRDALERPVTPPRRAGIEVTPAPLSGERVTLRAVLEEGTGPAPGQTPFFVVRRDATRAGRRIEARESSAPGTYEAEYAFPSSGVFRVEFHAGDAPGSLRLDVEVRVERSRRPEDEPPVTTTGSLGPSPFTPLPAAASPVETAAPPSSLAARPSEPTSAASLAPPALPPAWTSGD
jgi:serine/threonine-protein kinase